MLTWALSFIAAREMPVMLSYGGGGFAIVAFLIFTLF
jgi:hypothetical protein